MRIKKLEKQTETMTPDLKAAQAEWENSVLRADRAWQVLKPGQMNAAAGTTLTADDQGRIMASGAKPRDEAYAIECDLPVRAVTGIRVQAMPNAALPRGGFDEFKDDAHLLRIIEKIVSRVGRRVDESSPLVDARLPDGSRVNAAIPPVAVDGPLLSIRRFGRDTLQGEDLVKKLAMTEGMLQLLQCCVKARLSIVIAGGTGAGKTTLLNVLICARIGEVNNSEILDVCHFDL